MGQLRISDGNRNARSGDFHNVPLSASTAILSSVADMCNCEDGSDTDVTPNLLDRLRSLSELPKREENKLSSNCR